MHSKKFKKTKISTILFANIIIIALTYINRANVSDVLWIYLLQSFAIIIAVVIALLTKKRIVEAIGVLLGFFFLFGLLATFLALAMSVAFDQATPTGSNSDIFGLSTITLGFCTYLVGYLFTLVLIPFFSKDNNTKDGDPIEESILSLGIRMLPIFCIVFLVLLIGPGIGLIGGQLLLIAFQLVKTALDFAADAKN